MVVVDPAFSVLNKQFTVPIENVPSLKDSDDRKFEMLLQALFNLAGPAALQSALAAVSLCEIRTNWTRTMTEQVPSLLWLKAWAAEAACKRHLTLMPILGRCQFAETPG